MVTTPTPRERAAAAFEVIDRYLPNDPRTVVAMQQLARAMDDEFGPLPPETVLEQMSRLRRAKSTEVTP